MAEKTVVHIGENSPEKVAFDLMKEVAAVEGKVLYKTKDRASEMADRKWVLDTYAECLKAVQGKRLVS